MAQNYPYPNDVIYARNVLAVVKRYHGFMHKETTAQIKVARR